MNGVTSPGSGFRGSRRGCLLLTDQSPEMAAKRLTELAQPFAFVDANSDHWMPAGFLNPQEAELDKVDEFLTRPQQKVLSEWWHTVSARTPNWDIASTCTIDGRKGLILIEAKAHDDELASQDKSTSQRNHNQIAAAVIEASNALNDVLPGFSLSVESHYQLCNRFAWSWKIASIGVPVVLVYLGFLNDEDMASSGYKTFDSESTWQARVHEYARGFVPDNAWGRSLDIDGTCLVPIIQSRDMNQIS